MSPHHLAERATSLEADKALLVATLRSILAHLSTTGLPGGVADEIRNTLSRVGAPSLAPRLPASAIGD